MFMQGSKDRQCISTSKANEAREMDAEVRAEFDTHFDALLQQRFPSLPELWNKSSDGIYLDRDVREWRWMCEQSWRASRREAFGWVIEIADSALRCTVTGNRYGTDIIKAGFGCPCSHCGYHAALRQERDKL